MTVIPERTVEAAWKEVSSLPESKAQQYIEKITQSQPALMVFVLASMEDLGREAQELGLFIFVIILRMFETHFGSKLKTVEIEAVERLRHDTEQSLVALDGADETALEDAAISQASAQPFVMKYIAEALLDPDPQDGVNLTEEEIGEIVITMKTAVDALQEAAG